jgi:hypothetical protein
MKLITKILGKVNEYNEPPQLSYVTLVDTDTGKIHFTDAVSEKLKEKGITYPNCEFELLILQNENHQFSIELIKLNSTNSPIFNNNNNNNKNDNLNNNNTVNNSSNNTPNPQITATPPPNINP